MPDQPTDRVHALLNVAVLALVVGVLILLAGAGGTLAGIVAGGL